MKLHENKELFKDVIKNVSNKLGITSSIVEKDYFVTIFLSKLSEKVPDLIFKGGTSLSKCFKLINRFSEDIDLSLKIETKSYGKRKKLKEAIIETCKELDFKLLNIDNIRSRRDYNCYEVEYPIIFESTGLKQYLLIETVFIVKTYPTIKKELNTLIYDVFKTNGELINNFDLKPIDINVQTLERTFVDKIFAICDYYLSNKINGHSRHIYDIYYLFSVIDINDELINLIKMVREDRKLNKTCYSSNDSYDINLLLQKIVDEKTYYNDYINITGKLIYDNISYNAAIDTLLKIVKLNIF